MATFVSTLVPELAIGAIQKNYLSYLFYRLLAARDTPPPWERRLSSELTITSHFDSQMSPEITLTSEFPILCIIANFSSLENLSDRHAPYSPCHPIAPPLICAVRRSNKGGIRSRRCSNRESTRRSSRNGSTARSCPSPRRATHGDRP